MSDMKLNVVEDRGVQEESKAELHMRRWDSMMGNLTIAHRIHVARL